MSRSEMITQMYQKADVLTFANPKYAHRVLSYMESLLAKDIGEGDITSLASISADLIIKAGIRAKQEGIVAGIEEALMFYQAHDVSAKAVAQDGLLVKKGALLVEIEGNARDVLALERTVLNVMRRMSGIATLTKEYADRIRCKVAATRKVCMDEYLEKRAVYIGGGLSHRLGLDDFIMVKDRHLDCIRKEGFSDPITEAIRRCYANAPGRYVEVEVESVEDAITCANAFYAYKPRDAVCAIMLDNMNPFEVNYVIQELQHLPVYSTMIVEASGGITISNAKNYALAGVDVISTSEITERAPQLDITHRIIE